MSVINDLEEIASYKCLENEQPSVEEIKNYIENKFSVNVFKIVLKKKEENKISQVYFYFKTNQDRKFVETKAEHGDFGGCFPIEGQNITNILKNYNLEFSANLAEGFGIMFRSFEELALRACYFSAFQEFKNFREEVFNANTMEKIDSSTLYITYKTKQDFENAQKSGEIENLTKKFFDLIKKYDTYNYITKEKHLITKFDSVETQMDPRSFSDYFSCCMQKI